MKINLNQLFGLEGRVAAVTGGGGELCGVMAEALADLGVIAPSKARRILQGESPCREGSR